MKISILIKVSIDENINIDQKINFDQYINIVVSHHPFVDFDTLTLEYQKEIWKIDEEINLIQKGK